MGKENIRPKVITKNAFNEIEDCECGKPVFKYQDITKNQFVMKCPNTKYELDIKTRKWILSKKQPCKLYNIYQGERPVFSEIKNKVITPYVEKLDLEKRLRFLFDYLLISNHSSTIQEIDLLVINKLKREPRKCFYYPSIGNLRVSHYESFEDYRDRIFSEKIIDKETPVPLVPLVPFVPLVPKVQVVPPLTPKPVNSFKQDLKSFFKNTVEENVRSEFIVVSDSESDENESEFESEDSLSESDRGSEFSDKSEETLFFEEPEEIDDYDEPGDYEDAYD